MDSAGYENPQQRALSSKVRTGQATAASSDFGFGSSLVDETGECVAEDIRCEPLEKLASYDKDDCELACGRKKKATDRCYDRCITRNESDLYAMVKFYCCDVDACRERQDRQKFEDTVNDERLKRNDCVDKCDDKYGNAGADKLQDCYDRCNSVCNNAVWGRCSSITRRNCCENLTEPWCNDENTPPYGEEACTGAGRRDGSRDGVLWEMNRIPCAE